MSQPHFARTSAFLFLATNVGSLVQYIFQGMMKRMLSSPEFGLMNTLLNLMSIIGAPASAIQMDLTRRTALATNPLDVPSGLQRTRATLLRSAPYCGVVTLLLLLIRHPLAAFFKTSDTQAIGMVAMGVFVYVMGNVSQGLFVGMHWFRLLGVLGFSMAVLRVLVGYVLVGLGMGTGGALIATIIVGLVPLGCLGWLASGSRATVAPPPPEGKEENIFWLGLLVIGVNTVVTNVDLLLVKHYFSETQATGFATAGIFGRAMIFVLGPMGMALLPLSTVQSNRAGEDRDRVFWQCLKLCALLGVAAATFGGLFAKVGLILLGDPAVPETAQLVRYYLWAMLPFALVTVMMNHLLALNSWRMAWRAALLAGLYPMGIVFWHGSLIKVLCVNFVFGGLILLTLLRVCLKCKPPVLQPLQT